MDYLSSDDSDSELLDLIEEFDEDSESEDETKIRKVYKTRAVAKVQQDLFEKDKAKKAERKEMDFKHRKDILKQINEKERERINHLKEKFEDGKAYRMSQEMHDNQISEYIKTKVNKLKQEALPDRYIKDIERQLQLRE